MPATAPAKGRAGEGRDPEQIDHRRDYERQLLYAEAVQTVVSLLASSEISQRELAARLQISEGRISRILSGRENTTMKTIADLGWALGIRFALVSVPFDDRADTPAQGDPSPPRWLASQRRLLAGATKADGPPPPPK